MGAGEARPHTPTETVKFARTMSYKRIGKGAQLVDYFGRRAAEGEAW